MAATSLLPLSDVLKATFPSSSRSSYTSLVFLGLHRYSNFAILLSYVNFILFLLYLKKSNYSQFAAYIHSIVIIIIIVVVVVLLHSSVHEVTDFFFHKSNWKDWYCPRIQKNFVPFKKLSLTNFNIINALVIRVSFLIIFFYVCVCHFYFSYVAMLSPLIGFMVLLPGFQ